MVQMLASRSTYTFSSGTPPETPGPILRNGSPWDLAGATVYVVFRDPTGATFQRVATLSMYGGTLCVAQYTTVPTDLTVIGWWSRTWRVVQSGTDVTLEPPIAFAVA